MNCRALLCHCSDRILLELVFKRHDPQDLRAQYSEPILGAPHLEGILSSLENLFHQFADGPGINRAHLFRRDNGTPLARTGMLALCVENTNCRRLFSGA